MSVPGSLAIAVLGSDGSGRERIGAWARTAGADVEMWSDGPILIAHRPGRACALSVGPRWACLLDGSLYERPGASGGPAADAAWLAQAFASTGPSLFAGLRGDYWALFWDRQDQRGALVGDQLGVRAPYLAEGDGRFVCASELQPAIAALAFRPGPDPVALAHWLMLSQAPDGRTLHAGIRRHPGGHWRDLSAAGAGPPQPYWQPRFAAPGRRSRAQAVAEVRQALRRAVARRVAPEPGQTAVLLSGGLDSSAVAALAAPLAPGLGAYSAVFPDHPDVDESALIARTRASLRLPGTEVAVREGGLIAGAVRYLQAWGAPPSSPNLAFWVPLFTRAGADGRHVMLDGEGGDEVLGFAPYLLADRLRAGRWISALRLSARWPGWEGTRDPAALLALLREYGARGALPPSAHLLMRRLRPLRRYAPAWLGEPLAGAWLSSERSPFAFKELGGPRWWGYLAEATTRAPALAAVLEAARRRAALAGLEARHPFFDLDLIELVLGLDPELAFDPRFSRPLLREALAGDLHDQVRLRNGKRYFDRILQEALAGPELPVARRLLDPGQAELGAFVDIAALHRLLFAHSPGAHPLGPTVWSFTVWRAVTAEAWLRLERGRGLDLEGAEPLHRFEVHRAVET